MQVAHCAESQATSHTVPQTHSAALLWPSQTLTLDGFFAFQVADASAVSIRSRGKDAIAVGTWGDAGGHREGPVVCDPK